MFLHRVMASKEDGARGCSKWESVAEGEKLLLYILYLIFRKNRTN